MLLRLPPTVIGIWQDREDFISVFSLAVVDSSGDYSFLIDKDVNFIREAYPASSTSGLPKYYAQFDGDSRRRFR